MASKLTKLPQEHPANGWPFLDDERLIKDTPKVYHYTGLRGLDGIASTRTIWATRYDYTNDEQEARAAIGSIADAILPESWPAIKKYFASRPHLKNKITRPLREVSELDVRAYTQSLTTSMSRMAPSFIASFAAHAEPHERKGGLLSLWRHYGIDGVAIEFDSAKLNAGFEPYWEQNRVFSIYLDRVTYGAADKRFAEQLAQVPNIRAAYIEFFRATINAKKPADLPIRVEKELHEFSVITFSHKHPGFTDEREVRLIALIADYNFAKLNPDDERPEIKVLAPVPRIEVPCGDAITGVMIGPNVDQAKVELRVQEILRSSGLSVPVTRSDIPFRPAPPVVAPP